MKREEKGQFLILTTIKLDLDFRHRKKEVGEFSQRENLRSLILYKVYRDERSRKRSSRVLTISSSLFLKSTKCQSIEHKRDFFLLSSRPIRTREAGKREMLEL